MKNPAGFTLVELLIVTVLGALLVIAAYQVLLVNQRTFTAQNAQIQGQQAVRTGVNVLFGELRELSRTDSDIRAIAADSISVRVNRNFGLVCSVNLTTGALDVVRFGSWFGESDSVVVYAENAPNSAADDVWLQGQVTARDTTISCGGRPAQRLTIPRVATAASFADTVRVGSNVRSFKYHTYGLYTFEGERYLGRKERGGSQAPLVGPLRGTDGLAFRYLDSTGTVTTTLDVISAIEVTLRTTSEVLGPSGQQVADSLTTLVRLRN